MHSWTLAFLGLAAALAVSLVLIAVAPRIGWMDSPDQQRKHHTAPTSRTGGLALWLVLVAIQIMGWMPWQLDHLQWAGIHTMALLGALDDRFNIRARTKAGLGLAVAILLAADGAHWLSHTTDQVEFLWFTLPTHPSATFPLLLAWFWGIPQALNLIDGINGLSMGFGLLVLGALAGSTGCHPAALGGALLAILLLNFPRAKHFLGDCGALMLGTLLAVLAMRLLVPQNGGFPLWVFAYPVVDVSQVVAVRLWHGTPLGSGDRSHLHHWMMDRLGQRAWLATPVLLVLAVLPMARIQNFAGSTALATIGILAILTLASKVFLDNIHIPLPLKTHPTPRRRESTNHPQPDQGASI